MQVRAISPLLTECLWRAISGTHSLPNSVRQIWDEPSHPGAQSIHRSRSRNVQSAVVFVAPSEIRWLFGHDNGPEMMPLRIPNPDSLGTGHKKVPSLIHFDSIGNTIMRLPLFLTKNATIPQSPVIGDVVCTALSFRPVIPI